MKIINNEIIPVAGTFEGLPDGTVFYYCGTYVIKAGGLAVDLQNGEVNHPMLDYIVGETFPDAALYLHGAPNE